VSSVATTSTKPPPVLKSDIKRVLERMQVRYRETKGGYDCIHLPSIDLNSLNEAQTQRYQHPHQRSGGPEGTARRSLAHKASKLTFPGGNKGKEKESDAAAAAEKDKEKEAPGRPSATASSGSSSFFNAPAPAVITLPNASERPPSTGPDQSPQPEGSNPSLLHDDQRPRSPSKPKFLPPIPRDFAAPPVAKDASRPANGETEKDPFDVSNQNSLSVRFEINIVKVRMDGVDLSPLAFLT
jgi:serine/threonine protein kinase KIN1/2